MKKIIILLLLIILFLAGFSIHAVAFDPTPPTNNSDIIDSSAENSDPVTTPDVSPAKEKKANDSPSNSAGPEPVSSGQQGGTVIDQYDPYAYAGEKTPEQQLTDQAQQQYGGPRLSALSVEGVELIPVFSRETFAYAAYLPAGQNSVTISAAASGSVYIDGAAGATRRVALLGDEQTVRVIVAEDRGSTTYTVLLLRAPDLQQQIVGGIPRITHISVSNGVARAEQKLTGADGSDIVINLPAGGSNKYTVTVTVDTVTAVYFNNIRVYNGFKESGGAWLWTRQDIEATTEETLLGVHLVDGETKAALNYYSFRLKRERQAGLRIELQVGNEQALVNGKLHILDAPPQIVSRHTMVPLRFIAEGLGAAVSWDSTERRVDIKAEDKTLHLFIGKKTEGLPEAPFIEKGYTMVPLRYISEQLDCAVEWLGTTKEIVITR